MRVLVCGDRNWTDYAFILAWITQLKKNHEEIDGLLRDTGYFGSMGTPEERLNPLIIIEGEAQGVDVMSRVAGNALGLEVLRFPADWNKYGKAAGAIRNKQMLEEGQPDCVLAFHDQIQESKGTKNMVALARRAGLRVKILTHQDGLPSST